MPARSIRDLRNELATKEKLLAKLEARRTALTKEMEKVDREVAALTGGAVVARRGRGAAKAKAKAKAPVSRKRATGKPLTAFIADALKSVKGGLSVTHVAEAVTKAGYKSHSKDFYAIVAKTLLTDDRFKRVKRGVYALA